MCLDYTNTNSVYTYDEWKWNQSKLPKRKANNFKWKLRGEKNLVFYVLSTQRKEVLFQL